MSDSGPGLAPTHRQSRLLQRLQTEAYVETHRLSAWLGVSEATVRRDLTDLESRGLIRRTRGGALPAVQITQDWSPEERRVRHAAEKARIGRAAAALVAEGDAVFLDSGTTTLEVARCLMRRHDLTFVTNGTDILACLAAAGAPRLHLTGGAYCPAIHGLTGGLAAEAIRRFNVDKLFLSVSAIDLARGQIGMSGPELAATQRAMIEIARMVIVVADHSKFTRSALSVVTTLEAIDRIVTDSAAAPRLEGLPEPLREKIILA